jgi:hypothetical protein
MKGHCPDGAVRDDSVVKLEKIHTGENPVIEY